MYNTISYLDKTRLLYGTDRLKTTFHEIATKNIQKAITLLNDSELHFITLFILMKEIEEFSLYDYINPRNICALKTCSKILKDGKLTENLYSESKEMTLDTLKWMLKTGAKDDGFSNEYDKILDGIVSLLINTYKEKTILPTIAEMIFKRNRQGLFIHDLVWAFFKANDTFTLKIIAGYLDSPHKKDVELVHKLLNIDASNSNITKYNSYISWLKENHPYIFFTSEGFQRTSSPQPVKVNLGAKYLRKGISPQSGEHYTPLNENECKCLDNFQELDHSVKNILSDYSHLIYSKNIKQWNNWITKPIDQQINIAKASLGGLQ